MPFNVKHNAMVKKVTGKQTQGSLGTSGRKTPGTRYGLIFDWRVGSNTSGRLSDRYGCSLRDGK